MRPRTGRGSAAAPRATPAARLVGLALLAPALAAAGALLPARGAHAAPRPQPLVTRAQADSALGAAPSAARDRAIGDWAKHAPVADLVWLLRRPPRELGNLELPLLDDALAATPAERASLRQRLLARRALAAPRAARKGETPLPDLAALRPYATVFRVAALFPDQGEYAGYGRALRVSVADGLAWGRAPGAPLLTLDTLGTGDGDPARVASAFEDAAARSDVVVGELLSGPTLSIATAARNAGLTLVSPTATDERIGRVGPRVFQVGPGGEARARALADVVLGGEAHTVAVAGSASGIRDPFATAFEHEAAARGGRVARHDVVAGGGVETTRLAAALKTSGADVLLWEGPGRDAEALIHALAVAGASLRVCGGPALSPDAMRAAVRPLLEGVAWVDDDWHLPAAVRAHLDSLASVAGVRPGSLWTRGFLAGRRIAAAIDGGALTASEVAAALRRRGDAGDAGGGFLDLAPDHATLPVYVVRRGRAVEARGAADQ